MDANDITALQSLLKIMNVSIRKKKSAHYYNELNQAVQYMVNILGLKVELKAMSQEDKNMYHQWEEARKNKNFDLADQLRAKLTERGIL